MSSLRAGTAPAPPHHRHLDRLNRTGPGAARPARRVTGEQVADAVLSGSWVIDLRGRDAFAAAHLPGTLNVEGGRQLARHVGWLVPWDDDIVLLTDSPEVLAPALADLAGLGIDGVAAHVLPGDGTGLTARYRRADWGDFRAALAVSDPVVVDVRDHDEWQAGHLPGALHLEVQDVERASRTLPIGQVWVHCRTGYRAGIAASLLHRMGRDVVHLDDSWDRRGDVHLVAAPAAA